MHADTRGNSGAYPRIQNAMRLAAQALLSTLWRRHYGASGTAAVLPKALCWQPIWAMMPIRWPLFYGQLAEPSMDMMRYPGVV